MMFEPRTRHLFSAYYRGCQDDRTEQARQANVMRLISYNNRRVLHGLRPLDMPPALGGVIRQT